MEKNFSLELSSLKPQVEKNITTLKKDLLKVVDECEFVEIQDNKTYTTAKEHRTKLLSTSTSTEKQGKEVRKVIKDFDKYVASEYEALAEVTRTPYNKQQDEVKRYEQILEDERQKKLKEAEERANAIKQSITDFENLLIEKVDSLTFETLAAGKEEITSLSDAKKGYFEEFEVLFEASIEKIEIMLKNKGNELISEHERILEKRQEAEKGLVENKRDSILLKIAQLSTRNTDSNSVYAEIEEYAKLIIEFSENRYVRDDYAKALEFDLNNKVNQVLEDLKKEQEAEKQRAENERLLKEKQEQEAKQAAEKLEAEKQNKYQSRVIELLTIGFKNVDGEFVIENEKIAKSHLANSLAHNKNSLTELTDDQFRNYIQTITDVLNSPEIVEIEPEIIENPVNEVNEVVTPEIQDKEPSIKEPVKTNTDLVFKSLIVNLVNDLEPNVVEQIKNSFYYGNGKEEILKAFDIAFTKL